MALIMSAIGPQVDQYGNEIAFPTALLVAMPIFYAIFGYLFVAVGCALYNFMFKFIGGLEFESIKTGA